MTRTGTVRVGIGGWTFEPWQGHFYPEKLKARDELSYASSKLRTIEVNGTYYSTQKRETFAKWASEVPDGFVFTLKASRYATNKKVLGEAGESIARFLDSGVAELGDHLGPILWQFMATKKFDPVDFEAFLKLLPAKQEGVPLRHAVEVRHDSFLTPEFAALLDKHGVGLVIADHAEYPMLADVTADFTYLRLQTGSDAEPLCYDHSRMAEWKARIEALARGEQLRGLPMADPARAPSKQPRDVFAYFITEGKVNAPAGAMHLQAAIEAK
ncbi:DUF72 domain-containing protein [Gellertiella hungarica]|uniref:Uncharacterized protein YecE (DUF72 family) n=1 Tax=Gellertiella hungarica TaxID=1572859 RepID=A0A7W6J6A5_9HYPH|nr:DUF72 domain-containing protein [Gellertiella hungarica]MBB4064787.1 uncharacterized protein YecE (DUF72 family) [Gellertiella hungarica]